MILSLYSNSIQQIVHFHDAADILKCCSHSWTW